jgi:receptor protein-tyrosine kinase
VHAVTSPPPQDGRSSPAIDLAAAFAESGHSVVLVDGDLVNPALPRLLQLSGNALTQTGQKGFTTLLRGQHDLSESLVEVPGAGFALLAAGPVPSVRRELWGDDAVPRVIEMLRGHFDYVIIDTPPLTSYADGAVPAALGDGALVLGRIGHTKTSALRKALKVLQTAHAPVLGVVATCEPGHRKELSADRKHKGVTGDTDTAATPDDEDATQVARPQTTSHTTG